ncbi:NAD(P)/FAD-dependent oxidoreductase [Haliea atlantica]
MLKSIAIVGAGLAGATAAAQLRRSGYDGELILLGEEQWYPYQRPPLSKQIPVHGSFESLPVWEEQFYEDFKVRLLRNERVASINVAGKAIQLADGTLIPADRVILTTGSRPRKIQSEGADAANVHYLRTLRDAELLHKSIVPGSKVVVIGMGVIGAEIASVACTAGCHVAAVDPAPYPMIRSVGSYVGRWLADVHRNHGVISYMNTGVERFLSSRDRVHTVILKDGRKLECDSVVVGIGVVPNIELAADAGIKVADGIVVDERCVTSNEYVYAAGDVTYQPGFWGEGIRLETNENAAKQAEAAALALLGKHVAYRPIGWSWSDQFAINIQVAGRPYEKAEIILRGSLEEEAFTVFYVQDSVLYGAVSVNRASDMAACKRLIERRVRVDQSKLADLHVPLRELLS